MYYLCKLNNIRGIIYGEHVTDAVLEFDRLFLTDDEQEEEILRHDDNINRYCQKLIVDYQAGEIGRDYALEHIERRMNGDMNIIVILGR